MATPVAPVRTTQFASGAGQLGTGQVSVAATAGGTLICSATSTRRRLTIINHGTTAVYIGLTGVTTATGALLPGAVGANLTINVNVPVYGITASGTATVSFIEEYD